MYGTRTSNANNLKTSHNSRGIGNGWKGGHPELLVSSTRRFSHKPRVHAERGTWTHESQLQTQRPVQTRKMSFCKLTSSGGKRASNFRDWYNKNAAHDRWSKFPPVLIPQMESRFLSFQTLQMASSISFIADRNVKSQNGTLSRIYSSSSSLQILNLITRDFPRQARQDKLQIRTIVAIHHKSDFGSQAVCVVWWSAFGLETGLG